MATNIDLRHRLPVARDQGQRPTCLAFAVSDAHLVAGSRPGLLSADYLHYCAASRAKVTLNSGVSLARIQEALRLDGQPLESECPYSDARDASWKPSLPFVQVWRRDSTVQTAGKPSDLLAAALINGTMPVLAFRMSRSFFRPNPQSHFVAEDGSLDRVSHAVLCVGAETSEGKAKYLVRNSWGSSWGDNGYAWLDKAYIDARAIGIVEVEGTTQ